jgi:hypothetical protein
MSKKNLNATIGSILRKTSLLSAIVLPQYMFSDQVETVLEEPSNTPSFIAQTGRTIATYAHKNETQKTQSEAMNNIVLNSRIQIGGNYTRLNLRPHLSSSFNGNLGGAQAIYEYMPANSLYAGVKVCWREGRTHGSDGRRSILYLDGQERIGYTFGNTFGNPNWTATLFSGLGYHYLGQKFYPTIGSSVRFNYNEFYIPVGFLTNYDVSPCFGIGVDFTWMPQVYPTVSIIPLRGARWNLAYKFANFYVSVPLTFILTKDNRFQLIVNPFYERWQDGHSTAKLSGLVSLGLPGNTYNFYGVDVNFGYCF